MADEQPAKASAAGSSQTPAEQAVPAPRHDPVLAGRIVELLRPALSRPGAILVDATLGLGGHSAALLAAAAQARLIGIDRDPDALAIAAARLRPWAARVDLVHAGYDELPQVLAARREEAISAVLLDLGVSSLQLDEGRRGFSYSRDAPLDMRMDQSRGISAYEVVNSYEAGDLARVLRTYGEERFARRIAEAIVRERAKAPIAGTSRLAEIVRAAVPAATRRTGGHPAKRTFQALRIEVNGELQALRSAMPAALSALEPGGRIAVLSYHSLEDRIVKRALTAAAHPERDADLPRGLPVAPPPPALRLLTRGGEQPDPAEVAANPRAASARLRAGERLTGALPAAVLEASQPRGRA